MRRLTTYRHASQELPPIGARGTTRDGQYGEVVGHDGDQFIMQFAGSVQGRFYSDEVTLESKSAIEQEGKWRTEGSEFHFAGDDYKELTDILGKPAPAIVQEGNEWGRVASKHSLNGPIGEDTNHDGIENCPKCGGVRTFTSGGQAVPGSKGQNMCYHCFHTWDKTTSKTADWSNPNNTDGIASVETYDPYGAFTATPGDCETCFGEGAFSELNPDGKGFGEEKTCADCGGTGKAS